MALKPWTLPSVATNTVTDLVAPGANKEVAVVSLIITNNDTANTATVVVTLTTSANAAKATLHRGQLVAGASVYIDSKIFIAAGETPDKVRVLSDVAAVSFIASGDES